MRELDRLIVSEGKPAMLVSDNGTEFTSTAILRCQEERSVTWHFIQLGRPIRNALVESFNGRIRDELLNEMLFSGFRQLVEEWRSTTTENAHIQASKGGHAERVCKEVQRGP